MNTADTSTIPERRTIEPGTSVVGDDEVASPEAAARSAGYVADMRRRSMDPASAKLGVWLVGRGVRHFGLAPKGIAAMVFGLLAGIGVRMAIAVMLTALAGEWTGLPLGRWVAIAAFYALLDIARLQHHAPSAHAEQEAREHTALLEKVESETDLRDLARFQRRWYRLPVSAATGAVLAVAILLVCWWVSPGGVAALPAGSIALLALLLFDLGEITAIAVFDVVFVRMQAACPHRLFWLDPVNTPEVRQQMRLMTGGAVFFGIQATVALVLAIVLVSPSSPVVLPLATGITLTAYAAIVTLGIDGRASIGKIVRRSRDRHLALLQELLEAHEPGDGIPGQSESGEVDRLIALYGFLRDASTSPQWTRSLGQTVVALIVPTLMFVVTVLGEVSAERFLEQILP